PSISSRRRRAGVSGEAHVHSPLFGQRCASAARAASPGLDATLDAHRLNALVRRFLIARGTTLLRSRYRSRPMRWYAMKHALDTDVLVDVGPMDALAGADEAKVCSL